MNITTTDRWYKSNSHYLMTAVAGVHRKLEQYIDRQQNRAVEAVADEQLNLDAIAASMSTPSALEQLCTTFNLSPFERNILLLCVGMAIFPNFSALCANAQGNREMAYPTFGLALEVFPQSHWSAFTPQAPLRHWQLLQVGTGQVITFCSLQIDESVLHYLFGEPYQDDRLMSLIQPLPVEAYCHTPLQPSHQQLADRLAAILSEAGNSSTFSIPQLCGLDVGDKWAIAVAACALMGHPLKLISAHRLPTDPDDLIHLFRRWEREVALTGSVLLLDCDRFNAGDSVRATSILQLIQGTTTPLIITTEERLHSPQRPLIAFDVPKLTRSEQLAIWKTNLGSVAAELNGHVEELVSQFNLSSPAIQSACEQLKIKSEKLEIEVDSPIQNQLWDFCRVQARPRLDDLAQRIDSTSTWDDLVLPEAQRQILRDISAHLRQRAKVYEVWGFAGKSNRGLGISALFAGASGTGKTMAADVLAKELRLDLYRIDLSAVVSKYIGETEKNLRRIFDTAEAGGAILLFDEADALFGKRTEVKDSHDRHANVEVSYLLQRMEAYQGLAILTTNLKGSLDQAFLRRIRFIVQFPFPDASQRAEIWQRIFPKKTPTEGLDMSKLAKLNVAGGNIRNISLNAAFLAANAGEPVMMKHILQATKSEYVKLERSLTDVEIKGWL
ncbi:AAA family ATPase [Coleofasciculus sp. FACHB-T130]|uniref:ATP-binding protein n=1 Tax=Cyanophyceae TaxID=3028117 RepID=UPI001686F53D|nr:AAA family ATPase [Coleofasciculus sp. FACHB-T130]MBD1880513.1 ATP-binding protein [Coleofasciculus sp. FACHB-T130]